VLKFILEDSFSLSCIGIPNHDGRLPSHLTCGDNIFLNIDIKTGDIIIVLSVDFLGVF